MRPLKPTVMLAVTVKLVRLWNAQWVQWARILTQANKQTKKETKKQRNKETNRRTNRQPARQTNKDTKKQTNQQTNKQTNERTNKQTNQVWQAMCIPRSGRLQTCFLSCPAAAIGGMLPSLYVLLPALFFTRLHGACQRRACFHDGVA